MLFSDIIRRQRKEGPLSRSAIVLKFLHNSALLGLESWPNVVIRHQVISTRQAAGQIDVNLVGRSQLAALKPPRVIVVSAPVSLRPA